MMRFRWLGLSMTVIVSWHMAAHVLADESTPDGFGHPPREFSSVPLWSWNGRLEPDQLRWQIDQMVDKGVYGGFMHARAGINLDTTPYFSDGWWRAVEACVEHGAKVGFATWIYDEDKWPSGAAGGRTIKANPQRNRRKGLRRVELRVSGPKDVPIRIPEARYVIAGRLATKTSIDPDSLVDVSTYNIGQGRAVDSAPTKDLRVAIVTQWDQQLLAEHCQALGCKVSTLPKKRAQEIQLDGVDVLISEIGAEGAGLPNDKVLSWIRKGGGCVDFSHSEPTAPLYDLEMVVEQDAAGHEWLMPEHPIASIPNPNPDAAYSGRRWSDQWWRGGKDFDAFDHVLADPRHSPPGITILARKEGKGHVVYSGATQASREGGRYVELLQNILVYASGRYGKTAKRPAAAPPEKPPWKCPEGDWVLFGFIPQVVDDGINYLNKQTVRDFMDITHEAYARRVGKHFGKTIPGVFYDEIHNSAVQIVWCEGFAERFRQMKGYDLIPLLPALSVDVGRKTPKIRCDYYDVYTTLYEEAWFKQLAEWCQARNLDLTGHTVEELSGYRTQGSYFRTIRHMQIPGTDNEDFRYRWPRWIDPWKPKQLASISHLYGWDRAGVEAMGGAGWAFTMDMARYGYNLLAAYGINFFMPHLFHYAQDKPTNVDDWPNSWFFRNPFWKYFKTFADHGSRLSYMLTGGTHVADVAVLYPITNLWAGDGEGTTRDTVARLAAGQIDCDVVDPDSLVRAKVEQGRLCIGNQRYRVLIVPGVRCMRRDTAEKVREFVRGRGLLVVHGRWPTDSPDEGRGDPTISRLSADLKGIRPSSPRQTVEWIGKHIDRDVIIGGEQSDTLRYHHVRRGAKDVYWLANDSRERRTWRVSFRATGAASLWQPEDGSICPVDLVVRTAGRTECDVRLDGWQGAFIVFDSAVERPPGGVRITSTNLRDARLVRRSGAEVTVSGLLAPGARSASVEATVHTDKDQRSASGSLAAAPAPATIALDRPWRFLPVGNLLDYEWRIDLDQAELDLPVMRMHWERGVDGRTLGWQGPSHDDVRWRKIKVFDALHAAEGADRYRTRWEGRFVSFYDYGNFKTSIGGKGLRCRKRVKLPSAASSGWLAVVCESPFTATVGGKTYSGNVGGQPQRFELPAHPSGEMEIAIRADNARAILVEGRLATADGRTIEIFSDQTWEASLNGKDWQPAWEYVAPPEKPFAEPDYPEQGPAPSVVWYRQDLPPCVVEIYEPKIEGRWQAWVDGRELSFEKGRATVAAASGDRMLGIRVDLGEKGHGLLEPIRLINQPVERPLGSWTRDHLAWYSGRAIYATTFRLDAGHKRGDIRLRLDLGQVCYCAEIWLNGKLVGTRIWPPYELDITDRAIEGENRLTVVVANLLANRELWDIFDDVKGQEWDRKWHDGNIRRDGWSLESGLLGPVTVIPLRRIELPLRPHP
ncbi:MAG: hypothetical protein JXQ73_30630 [Phycisphaerae bacterium]|nr:hypothetical protein [Phycisphaerae bacterium]